MRIRSTALLYRNFSSKPPGFTIPLRRSGENSSKNSKTPFTFPLRRNHVDRPTDLSKLARPFNEPRRLHTSLTSYLNEFQNKSFVLKNSIKTLGLSTGLVGSALKSFKEQAIAGKTSLTLKSLEVAGGKLHVLTARQLYTRNNTGIPQASYLCRAIYSDALAHCDDVYNRYEGSSCSLFVNDQ
jgi:hypothetical protein